MARSRGRVITGEIDENKDFTTSTKFFKRMQEDTEREVKDHSNDGAGASASAAKKRKVGGAGSSSYKL